MKISRLTQAMYLLSIICLGVTCSAATIPTKNKPGTAIFVMSTVKDEQYNINVFSKTNSYNADYISLIQKYPKFKGFSDSDFERKINKSIKLNTINSGDKVIDEAKSYNRDLKKDKLPPIKFEYSQNFSIIPSISPYYTVSFFTYQYSGGAHGISKIDYMTIDLSNNTIVELKDLFNPKIDYLNILNQELRVGLKSIATSDQIIFFKDIDEIEISDNQVFYINSKGDLVIVFNVYEIAPYAAGIIEVVIPYNNIQAYMK